MKERKQQSCSGLDFRHIERMKRERLVKKDYRAYLEGNGGRGRPRGRWMDRCLNNRGLTIPRLRVRKT